MVYFFLFFIFILAHHILGVKGELSPEKHDTLVNKNDIIERTDKIHFKHCLVSIYIDKKEICYNVTYLSQDENAIYYKKYLLLKTLNMNNVIAALEIILSFDRCFISNALVGSLGRYLDNILYDSHQYVSLYHENYGVTNLGKIQNNTYLCSRGSMALLQTISVLINHTANDLTSIIFEQDDCSAIFAEVLRKAITKHTPSKTTTNLYEINISDVTKGVNEILMDIKESKKDRRAYIVLASNKLTELLLKQANEYELNQFQDIWITTEANYYRSVIPNVLISCRINERSQFRPRSNDVINMTSSQLKSFTKLDMRDIERGNFTMDGIQSTEDGDIEVSLWWKGVRLQLERIKTETQLIALIMKVRDTGIFITGASSRRKTVVVSILGGPFLYDAQYLLNINKSGCDGNSMICLKADTSNGATKWHTTCCYGYTVDFLKQLSNLLKYEFSLYLVEDGKYGGLNQTSGTFNGLIGDVIQGKAAMAVAGLTINEERSRFVDFTTPFMRSEIGIVTLRTPKDKSYVNLRFINNLGTDVALTIGAFYLTSILIIYFLDNTTLKRINLFNRKYRHRHSRFRYIWQEAFTYISGLTFQREIGGENPQTKGGRTTALFMAFGMVVISTMYTASLTAELVSTKDSNKFLGLKDERMTKLDSSFKFATVKDTSIEAFFKESTDPNLRRMHMFMKQYNVDFFDEGMRQVRDGKLQAFLHEYPFQNYYIAKVSCDLELHENSVGQTYYGIAVQKGSLLQDVLSEAILLLHEDGLLHELNNKWVSSKCVTESQENAQFSLEFFATPILMVFFMFFVCGAFLLAEILYWKRHHKQRKQSHHFTNWQDDSFREKYYKRRTRSSLTLMF